MSDLSEILRRQALYGEPNKIVIAASDPPKPEPVVITIWDESYTAGSFHKAEIDKHWRPEPRPRSKRGQRRAQWGRG